MTVQIDRHVDTRGVHGPAVSRITPQDMLERGKLKRAPEWIDSVRGQGTVESVELPVDGRTRFVLTEDWHVRLDEKADTAPVQAWVVVEDANGQQAELQMSKASLIEAASEIGLTKTYIAKTPARLITPHLDYWFHSPDRRLSAMMVGGVVQGFPKQTYASIDNVALFERAVRKIAAHYNIDENEVLVDHGKSRVALQSAFATFVVPDATRDMRQDDPWSGGVAVRNSPTGKHGTDVRSYLFRWWCTNGATTEGKKTATFNRRERDDAIDWIGRAVDEALGHLEGEFDRVEAMTREPIEGEVRTAIANLAQRYKLSDPVIRAIEAQMMETPDVTMYGLMNAVTAAAHTTRGLPTSVRERMMDVGGDFVYGAGRCESCHSIVVEDHDH